VTREFLLTTEASPVNSLLVVFTVEREVLIERSLERFGTSDPINAYDRRWESPKGGITIFKFRSNTVEEFEAYYARLREVLESEVHPFKPEFQPRLLTLREIRRALKEFLRKRQKQDSEG
jgi:hypothetical protein